MNYMHEDFTPNRSISPINIDPKKFTKRQLMDLELDRYHIKEFLKRGIYYGILSKWYLYTYNWRLIGFIEFHELNNNEKEELISFIREYKDFEYMGWFYISKNYKDLSTSFLREFSNYINFKERIKHHDLSYDEYGPFNPKDYKRKEI